jgi:hypothetical protein
MFYASNLSPALRLSLARLHTFVPLEISERFHDVSLFMKHKVVERLLKPV